MYLTADGRRSTTVPEHLRDIDWLKAAVWMCLVVATVATWGAVASIALGAAG